MVEAICVRLSGVRELSGPDISEFVRGYCLACTENDAQHTMGQGPALMGIDETEKREVIIKIITRDAVKTTHPILQALNV